MTVIGVTMVRDEEDVIGSTVAHMLDQVDAVIVADNLSTDATPEILRDMIGPSSGRLSVIADDDPAYMQSEKMTRLAHAAGLLGATWIVPFDADELWYSSADAIDNRRRLADELAEIPDRWHVAPARLFDYVATGLDPAEELEPDPTRRLRWRRPDPAPLPKVAVRYRPDLVIHQGNHGAHYDEFAPAPFDPVLVVRHYPYRSIEQVVRKVRNGSAAYRAAGDRQPITAGSHWRSWGDMLQANGPDAIAELFRTWYWRRDPRQPARIYDEQQPALVYDPAVLP